MTSGVRLRRLAPARSPDVIQWQKSTYSGGAEGNECVELARTNDSLLLRESDDPDRILHVTGTASPVCFR
ncbi:MULTISPECIES: DUF397 domain-containing protein [unclassified Streptomyces]|uniref:DUF397 domain-containing protein n=1 Tax=unclassified Streptomyces TaxID=2593676 RepID=UPI002B1D5ACF|nr:MULTISPECIES: DUF397 domain-containing protein [unclassified Streptomyces]